MFFRTSSPSFIRHHDARTQRIQAAQDIKRVSCNTRVLFLTGHEGDEYVSAALDLDAQGCVFKFRMYSGLIVAIEQASLARSLFRTAVQEGPKSPVLHHSPISISLAGPV
jgi:DNA-binding NarL/FixJ family response regulator